MVCHGLNIPGIDVLGCQSVYSWLWVSKFSYLMVMSWRFMIASSIFSMVLCGVKEFGCISFKISVLKGVSQSWLSLWRMHNLRDASWEHSDIFWSVPRCGHFDSWLHPKEFGFNCFEISVLKGVSQSWLSLWRMHNLRDVSWEHSDILWSVPHCGHFVDIDERSSTLFFTHLTGRKFSQLAYKFEVWNSCFFFRTIKHLFSNIWLLSL